MERSFRFTKKERITQPQDFRRVMKSGRRHTSRNFILFILKNEKTFHRLGIVVKKEIGPATYRNRMKRYLREFFRLHKHQIKGSYDIILMAKKGCLFRGYQEAEKELKGLFIVWKREQPTSGLMKDSLFWSISINIHFQPFLGPAAVSLLPVRLMPRYPLNASESKRGLGSYSRGSSSAILSILVDTIQFPKLSKNIREEI